MVAGCEVRNERNARTKIFQFKVQPQRGDRTIPSQFSHPSTFLSCTPWKTVHSPQIFPLDLLGISVHDFNRMIHKNPLPILLCRFAMCCALIGSSHSAIAQQTEGGGAGGVKLPDNATLRSLQFEYDVYRAELLKPLKELQKKYDTNLQRLLEKHTKAGELQAVLAVKNEIEGYKEGKSTSADKAKFPELHRLQSIYKETAVKHQAEFDEKVPARHNCRFGYARRMVFLVQHQ